MGYTDDDFVIGYVGVVDRRKGLYELMHAYQIAKEEIDNLKLMIVGEVYEQEVEILGRKLGADFKGPIPHEMLPSYYNMFDVFTTLSHGEAFGLTLLEAMACGKPVVCTDIPAYKEIGADSAIFSPVNCPHTVANIWRELFESESLRKNLSREARRRALTFDWNKTAEKHARVFKEIFEEGR